MELAKQKKAAFQSTMELLVSQWKELDRHLKVWLGDEDEPKPKGLNLGDSAVKLENQDSFDSKMSELNDKKNDALMKLRELELTERMRQKEFQEKDRVLEKKGLDLDSQEQALAMRVIKLHSELEGIKKKNAGIHLGKKKLANLQEGYEIKKMMFDMKTQGFAGASSSRPKPPKSAVTMEGIQRKRRRDAASGCARNVPKTTVEGDGLSFLLNIVKTHSRSYVTVPVSFVSAYDLSVKKYVILSTDKGDFRLEVRHYSPSVGSTTVRFFQGWKDFYTKNLLEVGCQCLFRLKENTVNGDALGFSMDVSVLHR